MKTIVLLFFIIVCFWAYGQDYSQKKIPCEPVIYPIHFYHVLNHPLRQQRSATYLYQVLDTLNKYFKPTCIQFQVCKLDTIHDYNYFVLEDDPNTLERNDVRAMYYDDKAINIYWLNLNPPLPPTQTFFGICEEKKNKPYVFLTYANFQAPSKTDICVQLFRYFGLEYTASYPGSVELVNGSNSLITADSTWDTPADPGFLTFGSPDTFALPQTPPGISYLYTNRKDPNGEYYNPMVLNPMSIWMLNQKQPILTTEQYRKIVVNERKCRKRFWELE